MSGKTLTSAAVAILASAAVLSGCGDDDSTGGHDGHTDAAATTSAAASTVPTSSGAATGVRNDADIDFAREMIPHHQQAVAMAAMVPSRSTDPEVLDLAARIQAAQDPEIVTMTAWLRAWGVPATPTTGSGMDHGGMPMTPGAMPGMMSDEQMARMRDATGAEFDRLWLTGMIAHHRGAIEMARTELTAGADPEAKALAQRIIDTQQAEIARMQELLQG
ncbi:MULTISPECIES: DUF305 domain-containing protein [Nocardia]|uniref:DUF305 domain-containing protein n=1 Tax=Nocardia TaxID=1817 RepID=UPI000D695A8A|nr:MULTISPECIES: DUF305 domain-containing protein [Nocardia]